MTANLDSNDETESLKDKEKFEYFLREYDVLGRKLNKFIQAVRS